MNSNFKFYLWRSNCVSVSTDSRTDRRKDEIIWGGLGNLQFLQVDRLCRKDKKSLLLPSYSGCAVILFCFCERSFQIWPR